jgi:hypothetical protein
MKKLIAKNKQLSYTLKDLEKKKFVIKSIHKNLNFFSLIRLNVLKLQEFLAKKFVVSVTNRCLYTYNKKRYNKLTSFSRHIFLKCIRFNFIHGIKKSSW